MTGRARIVAVGVVGLLLVAVWYGVGWRHRQALAAMDQLLRKDREALQKRQRLILGGDLSPLARVKAVALSDGEYTLAKEPLALEGLAEGEGEVALSAAKGRRVRLRAPAPVTVNGSPATDRDLSLGDLILLKRLRLMLTWNGQDRVLVVHDPQAPARKAFAGPVFYPADSEYTFQGMFAPAPAGQAGTMRYEAVRGGPRELPLAGTIGVKVDGRNYRLSAYSEGGSGYLLVPFRDLGAGPSGRCLYVPMAKPGTPVRLDFNQAWYPPCAYSKLYVCPAVPQGNDLQVAIPAGEQVPPLGS